jgi:hypothetical protein
MSLQSASRRPSWLFCIIRSLVFSAALFGFVSNAWPECAWVLWAESYFSSVKSPSHSPSKWEVVDGFSTVQECQQTRRTLIIKYVPSSQRTDALESNMFFGSVDSDMKGAVQPITLRCLPEGLDPRATDRK